MFRKKKTIEDYKKEMLMEFAKVVSYILQEVSENELDRVYKIGKEAHKEFFEERRKRKKPKVETFEIKANSKEEAIKQLKSLELEEDIEKSIIDIISKH